MTTITPQQATVLLREQKAEITRLQQRHEQDTALIAELQNKLRASAVVATPSNAARFARGLRLPQ